MKAALLRKLSITYILIPNLLFSFGWFRQPYAGILIIGYIFLLLREFRKKEVSESYSFKEVIFLMLIALIWTFFSGAGGFSDQKSDFFAHNAKFYDLYKNPWPTYFQEIDRYACYYFGYFLVPSFIAKCIGQLHPLIIYFWTVIGYFLGFAWLYLLIDRNKAGLFAFFWFRGIGYILCLALQKTNLINIPVFRPVINGLVQQSMYAPNQFLGTWIVTCILIYDAFLKRQLKESVFPITLVVIWGVFPSVSLVLIYIFLWIRHFFAGKNYKELLTFSSISNFILPSLLILPALIYFLSANSGTIKGFLWQFGDPAQITFYYLVGIFLDLIIYFFLIRSLRSREKLIPFWLMKYLFLLIFIYSLYRIGYNNDWFYRTQIPIFIVIVIVLIRGANSYIKDRLLPASAFMKGLSFLVIAMMCLQMTAYVHLIRDNIIVKTFFPSATAFKPMPYNKYDNVYQLMKTVYKDRGDAEQYLGAKNSIYELYLSKNKKDI